MARKLSDQRGLSRYLPLFLLIIATSLMLRGMAAAGTAGDTEIGGLVIDQTRTLTGKEFYRQIYTLWGEPKVDYQYNIVIREIPSPRWGSMMIIEVNGQEAYRNTIRPRSAVVEEEAQKAIPLIRSRLTYMIQTNGNQNTDDLKGNGY